MFVWLLDHIISWIPVWVWMYLSGGGLAFYFIANILGHIPGFNTHHFILKLISVAMMFVGIFMWGGHGIMQVYQDAIEEMKKKIAVAEAKSAEANAELAKKHQDNVKIIHDVQLVYKDKIKSITETIDNECKINNTIINILNDAATNPAKDTK
jgi:hypothetical protein